MTLRLTTGKKITLIIILILLADQAIKLWVKTHMYLGESIHVFGDWCQIAFTENTGFAFGWSLGGTFGKVLLSVIRIGAVVAIGWYLNKLIKRKLPMGLLVGGAMLLAGAAGNIIDSAFYGLIFDQGTVISPEHGMAIGYSGIAQFSTDGYAPFLQGSVVDMFYMPIVDCTLPDWVPIWGGEDFVFFRPIFNLADASISVAFIYLLLFQRKNLSKLLNQKK